MKKVFYFVFAMVSVLIVGCSSDDDFDIPRIPGQNVETDEVQLLFRATAEKPTITFSVESGDNKQVSINWGDNGNLTSYETARKISYTYSGEDRDYIITLRAPKITSLDLTDQSLVNLCAVYLGDCPELTKLNVNEESRLSAFDLSKCPQFMTVTVSVNTPSFDWIGLSNVQYLDVMMNASADIDLTNCPEMLRCGIFVETAKANRINRLKISGASKLKSLTVVGFSNWNSPPNPVEIETWDIDAPAIDNMDVRKVIVKGDIDLEKMAGLKRLALYDFDCKGEFTFNSGLEELSIQNIWNPNVFWELDKLDLSNHKSLTYLWVVMQPGIKDVDVSGADRLQRFILTDCDLVSTISLENLPSLTSTSYSHNASLEKIKLSNLPNLLNITAQDNPKLSAIELSNSPKTWYVDLKESNLGSDAIKSIFSALPAVYPGAGERRYSIAGNPGDLPAVHDFIQNLGQWNNMDDLMQGNAKQHTEETQSVVPNIDHGIIRLQAK